MTSAQTETIELPEQIRIDIKSPVGLVRQLAQIRSFTDSPLTNFTIGKVSGRLYTRKSGERVLLVETKVTPPDKVDEVLWLRADQPASQWLKPLPITQRSAIPGGVSHLATSVVDSWKGRFFYVEERTNGAVVIPGLRPPQIGTLYAALSLWTVTDEPANIVMP